MTKDGNIVSSETIPEKHLDAWRGVLNTHAMACWLIDRYGTAEQRDRLLPRLATGELRAAYSISEPDAGSDVQAIRTTAGGWVTSANGMA